MTISRVTSYLPSSTNCPMTTIAATSSSRTTSVHLNNLPTIDPDFFCGSAIPSPPSGSAFRGLPQLFALCPQALLLLAQFRRQCGAKILRTEYRPDFDFLPAV